jgi:predicted alpha/beta-hydrolase family hydrolase
MIIHLGLTQHSLQYAQPRQKAHALPLTLKSIAIKPRALPTRSAPGQSFSRQVPQQTHTAHLNQDMASQPTDKPCLMNFIYQPSKSALAALVSDRKVSVSQNKDWIAFTPARKAAKGLIFYPGAMVDAQSYAALARKLSEKGYQVVIAKMPMSFSVFAPRKADKIIQDFPHIASWAVAGHSLGGIAAADYAKTPHAKVKGLICYGSFPAKNLSGSALKTLIILGGKDRLVESWKFFDFKKLLPQKAKTVIIEGGNHSNFGDYGLQWQDHAADISREQQQKIIVFQTAKIMKHLND